MANSYKLYWKPDTGAFIPHVLLNASGSDFELIHIDTGAGQQNTEEFKAINPREQIPVLVTPEGNAISESAAIVLHLTEKFPQLDLLPPEASLERAEVYRWMLFFATNLYEADLRYYYSHRYTTEEDAGGVKQAGANSMSSGFDLIDAELGTRDWLVGGKPSVADLYLLMLADWHPDHKAMFERCKNVARVRRNTRNLPIIDNVWKANH